MKILKSISFQFLWCLIMSFVIASFPLPVSGYLDPGTGSFLAQFLIAMIMALLVFGRTFRNKVLSFFRRLPVSRSKPDFHNRSDKDDTQS